MALLTTESEYMAATHASKEEVWLQRLCSSIGLVQQAVRIDCDSQSAIFLVKNPTYCNVPDLASLGNAANVCVGSKVYNI